MVAGRGATDSFGYGDEEVSAVKVLIRFHLERAWWTSRGDDEGFLSFAPFRSCDPSG